MAEENEIINFLLDVVKNNPQLIKAISEDIIINGIEPFLNGLEEIK